MVRKSATLLAALSVALLVYVVFVILVFNRVSQIINLRWGGPPPAPLVMNGKLNVFGVYVPIPVVTALASIAPTWWIASTVFMAVRRRNRERLGLCLDCGHRLTSKRGRCPGCGVRYEISRVVREPCFPVKISPPHSPAR